jgi:hypothetical protein
MAFAVNPNQTTQKQYYIRFLFLFIYIFTLLYLYYILVESGSNPIITILLIIFLFLLIAGILFRRKSKSLYSKMFPEKRKEHLFEKRTIPKEKKIESEQTQPKIIKPISLRTKYHKPIVLKCRNCGNLIPNFVKQCPFCNKKVKF